MQIITYLDYLLLPIYLAFFYGRAKKMALRFPDFRKFLITAFWLRMLGAVAYGMLVQYYYGYGDSRTFYFGNLVFREAISEDFANFNALFMPFDGVADWFNSVSNDNFFVTPFSAHSSNMVMRITTFISYLCFNKYLIISLFFGFFSFVGQWKLFMVLNDINKDRNRKLLAYAVLYTPSIWFWGSGLLKDSICIGGLGLIIHILYKFFVKKKFRIFDIILLAVLYFVISIIKSYIINIVALGIILIFLSTFVKAIKNKALRVIMIFLSIVMGSVLFYISDFSGQIVELTEESISQIESFQGLYTETQNKEESSRAGFGLGELTPTVTGLILKSPAVIFTVLFRPFLWESRSVFILLTSLESTLLLFSTFYLMFKIGFIKFNKMVFGTPALLFCFVTSLLFSLIIGFTTFNFGTMIRYKIIFLPFYYFLLVYLYCNYQQIKAARTLNGGFTELV